MNIFRGIVHFGYVVLLFILFIKLGSSGDDLDKKVSARNGILFTIAAIRV